LVSTTEAIFDHCILWKLLVRLTISIVQRVPHLQNAEKEAPVEAPAAAAAHAAKCSSPSPSRNPGAAANQLPGAPLPHSLSLPLFSTLPPDLAVFTARPRCRRKVRTSQIRTAAEEGTTSAPRSRTSRRGSPMGRRRRGGRGEDGEVAARDAVDGESGSRPHLALARGLRGRGG
jgi:hypothetical protein